MALAGIPDLPEEAFKHNGDRKIKPQGGGGGGPTQSTSYQTNIPEYMEPYVHEMMQATKGQIYDPSGGFRPYQSYASYDKTRGGSGESVAGFTPMQSGAMRGLQGYQLPQQGQYGSMMAAGAGLGAMGAGQQYARQATDPNATAAYMSPYMEGAVAPQMREAARQSAIQGQANQAQAVQQGAFGGARTGIVEAERQRNLAQQQADIYGKGTQTAFEQARQAQQYGADLNLKGLGLGMEGGKALGELGQQQYGQEMGVLGQQLAVGKQQQEYEQNRLNQVIQDYATSQQYPFMQLGMLSNMIRGQPMQAVTTQSYQAQPSFLQQGIGALGMVNSLQGNKSSKEGGIIKMASGGIASGLNDYELRDMSKRLGDNQLGAKMSDPNTDPSTKDILGGEMARRSQTRSAAGVGMASGGILAFAKGSEEAIDDEVAAAPADGRFIDVTSKKEEKKEAKKAAPSDSRVGYYAKEAEKIIGPALKEYEKPDVYTQGLEKVYARSQKEEAAPLSDYLKQIKETRTAAGADNSFMEEEKRRLLQRKREVDLDSEEQTNLRKAQAWAMFGSTPGPILASGLKAMSAYIEQTVEDKKERKKMLNEIDKAIFDVRKADYQEKAGDADAAMAFRNEAAKRSIEVGMKMSTIRTQQKSDVLKSRTDIAEKAVTSASGESQAAIAASGRASADKTAKAQSIYTNQLGKYEQENKERFDDAAKTLIDIKKLRDMKQEVPESLLGMETSAKAVIAERKAAHKQIAEAVANKYPEARELLMGVQMPSGSSAAPASGDALTYDPATRTLK
jgi:hypothetical protein